MSSQSSNASDQQQPCDSDDYHFDSSQVESATRFTSSQRSDASNSEHDDDDTYDYEEDFACGQRQDYTPDTSQIMRDTVAIMKTHADRMPASDPAPETEDPATPRPRRIKSLEALTTPSTPVASQRRTSQRRASVASHSSVASLASTGAPAPAEDVFDDDWPLSKFGAISQHHAPQWMITGQGPLPANWAEVPSMPPSLQSLTSASASTSRASSASSIASFSSTRTERDVRPFARRGLMKPARQLARDGAGGSARAGRSIKVTSEGSFQIIPAGGASQLAREGSLQSVAEEGEEDGKRGRKRRAPGEWDGETDEVNQRRLKKRRSALNAVAHI